MRISRLTEKDIPAAFAVLSEGKRLLAERGISQWNKGEYPGMRELRSDLSDGIGYTVKDGDTVVGYFVLTFEPEPAYEALTSGEWQNKGKYAALHRLAVSKLARGKGAADCAFAFAEETAKKGGALSLRIDTHPENRAMQKASGRAGLVKCCTLNLIGGDEDGEMRYGFEKVFD